MRINAAEFTCTSSLPRANYLVRALTKRKPMLLLLALACLGWSGARGTMDQKQFFFVSSEHNYSI